MNTVVGLLRSIFRERNVGILVFAFLFFSFTLVPIYEARRIERPFSPTITFYLIMVYYMVRSGVLVIGNTSSTYISELTKTYRQKWAWIVGLAVIWFIDSVQVAPRQANEQIDTTAFIVALMAVIPLSALAVLLPLVIGAAVRLKIHRIWLSMIISFGLLLLRIAIWVYVSLQYSFGSYDRVRYPITQGLADGGMFSMRDILTFRPSEPEFSQQILVFIIVGVATLFFIALFGAYIVYKER